jgi:hypothetical protein
MADAISTSGKWVTSDGRVVTEQPEEGRQLVAPNTPITPVMQAAIERAEAAAPPAPVVETPDGASDGDKSAEDETAPAKERATAPAKRASGR